jgi:hypothetical protein
LTISGDLFDPPIGTGEAFVGNYETTLGIVGFNSQLKSNTGEIGSPYYLSLSHEEPPHGTGIVGIITTDSPDKRVLQSITDESWNQRGRYLLSKPLSEIGKDKIFSWNRLKSMTITWIAGNGENGGDAPDVNGFTTNPPYELVDPNGHQINNTNRIMAPPFRSGEGLYVELLDAEYNSLSKVDLWRSMDVPTTEIIQRAIHGIGPIPGLPDPTAPFSFAKITGPFNPDSPYKATIHKYIGDKFTTTTINASAFGNVSNVSYFAIRQSFNTHQLDTYGVKNVVLTTF